MGINECRSRSSRAGRSCHSSDSGGSGRAGRSRCSGRPCRAGDSGGAGRSDRASRAGYTCCPCGTSGAGKSGSSSRPGCACGARESEPACRSRWTSGASGASGSVVWPGGVQRGTVRAVRTVPGAIEHDGSSFPDSHIPFYSGWEKGIHAEKQLITQKKRRCRYRRFFE